MNTPSTVTLSEFSVFPNPSKEQVTVILNITTYDKATMNISDLSGRVLYSESTTVIPGDNQWTLSVGDLHPGIYLLHLQNGEECRTRRLIIE
jgi:hypothetical protein